MDFNAVCRTCLTEKSLRPIFVSPTDNVYANTVLFTTGVKIEINDGYPQNICENCEKYLHDAIDFRKKCLITQQKLEQSKLKECHRVVPVEQDLYKATDDDSKSLKITNNTSFDSENIVCEPALEMKNEVDSKITKRVICTVCNKNLSIRSIDAHMTRRHPGSDERKVKCELCDEYVLKEKLNRHCLMMHGSGSYKCRYCKWNFENKEKLLEHVACCTRKKRKRGDSGRQLTECDICHKTMQRASIRVHKRIKHAGLGPVCEHCGRRFGNQFRLNEHYRAKHGYEKFRCKYCDFQSAGTLSLQNHERLHLGEKPFVCDTCGAKFHAAYLLAKHKQSHRTDKKFKCDICPSSFKANNSLHMHKRTCHSTIKYACTLCARAYNCRHYAVKHMRTVHRYAGPLPPLAKLPLTPAADLTEPE